MTPVHVDDRWDGLHGIARYAREVTQRLSVPWEPLGLSGAPSSPLCAFANVPRGLVYSPGYNAFLRADRQVLTVHDLIHLQTPWPGRAKYIAYYNAVVKPTIKRAGVVLTVSETSREAIADWLRAPSVEIVNAGIGVSPAFHNDVEPADADAPYLMYVGNLRKHKNVEVLIKALALVPDARLRVLIPEREHAQLDSLLAAHGVADRVTTLPRMDDDLLARQYRGASATVMPSLIEGFGLPPLESIMVGTPVIYWRGCTAVAETAAGAGIAVDEPGTAEAWADALRRVASQPRATKVAPPRVYDWNETARTVSEVLARF